MLNEAQITAVYIKFSFTFRIESQQKTNLAGSFFLFTGQAWYARPSDEALAHIAGFVPYHFSHLVSDTALFLP